MYVCGGVDALMKFSVQYYLHKNNTQSPSPRSLIFAIKGTVRPLMLSVLFYRDSASCATFRGNACLSSQQVFRKNSRLWGRMRMAPNLKEKMNMCNKPFNIQFRNHGQNYHTF